MGVFFKSTITQQPAIRNHRLPPWWAAYSRMSLLPYRLRNRWCLRLPYHPGFLKENEEEMVLGKIRKIALIPRFIPILGITIPKNILNFGIRAIFQRFHLSSSPISWEQFHFWKRTLKGGLLPEKGVLQKKKHRKITAMKNWTVLNQSTFIFFH